MPFLPSGTLEPGLRLKHEGAGTLGTRLRTRPVVIYLVQPHLKTIPCWSAITARETQARHSDAWKAGRTVTSVAEMKLNDADTAELAVR